MSKALIGIDPGPETCGLVVCDEHEGRPPLPARCEPTATLPQIRVLLTAGGERARTVVEQVEPRGQPLGHDLTRTIRMEARCTESAWANTFLTYGICPRDIRIAICGTAKATRPQVRRAVLDLYAEHYPHGGGSEPAIGTKKQPGPLYCLREVGSKQGDHHWSALYVIVAWWLRERENNV